MHSILNNGWLILIIFFFGTVVMLMMLVNCQGLTGSSREPHQIKASTMQKSGQAVTFATVSGAIFCRQRVALPPGASVHVKLVDISKQDVSAVTIAEQIITGPVQVPVSFELRYDPDKIDPRFTCAVQARISDGDRLLFITTQVFPVITQGYPIRVEVKVDPVNHK